MTIGFLFIIAKFVYHRDKEKVINAARKTIVRKPYKVSKQYPKEIRDRQWELVSIMTQFLDLNQCAHIVRDKLLWMEDRMEHMSIDYHHTR